MSFLIFWVFLALQGEDQPALKDLLTKVENQAYVSKPQYRDRMDLFDNILERYDNELRRHTKAEKVDDALHLLKQLRILSACAIKEAERPATPKDLRSKQVKKFEIRIRKVVETLDNLKLEVWSQYQLEFESTADELNELRNRLLVQMFGEGLLTDHKGDEEKPAKSEVSEESDSKLSGLFHAEAGGPAYPLSARAVDDRFTDKEFTKIQEHQELVKRVETFLAIAETRLQEIQRRMQNKPWEGKEENPLQFYTYWDMVHAYERAMDSVMINIDEKARYKMAQEKDIRKALQKLNEKIKEFIPQLTPIKDLAVKLQDEELYKEVQKAEKTSDDAKRGSEFGLGAPVKDDKR